MKNLSRPTTNNYHMMIPMLGLIRTNKITYKEIAKRTGTTTTDVRNAARRVLEEAREKKAR